MPWSDNLVILFKNYQQNWQKWRNQPPPFDALDHQMLTSLMQPTATALHFNQQLVEYFWQGYCHYRSANGCRAYYPGLGSIYGATNDAIEGVSRTLPLWASYLSSSLADQALAKVMQDAIRETFLNGTNPIHRFYWGTISNKSTLICEAADIALALWLVRKTVWPTYSPNEQQQILNWLKQVPGKTTADNNWHLFVAQVDAIITVLDPEHQFTSQALLDRIDSFYVGDGCYRDGEQGAVDLYNAWGFHYHFFWLKQVLPEYDFSKQQNYLLQYCDWFQHLFTEQGVVLYGRSLCYRFAMPCPLLIQASYRPSTEHSERALSTLLSNWQFFIRQGGLKNGRPSQGIFKDDERWLDPYSGPASSFWGCRSLILYYFIANQVDWSEVKLKPIAPALNLAIYLPELKLTIQKNSLQSGIELIILDNPLDSRPPLQKPGWRQRLRALLLADCCRRANNLQAMGLRRFSSSLTEYQ